MANILVAHTHGGPNKDQCQSLPEHCRNVASICQAHCSALGLSHTGYLSGYIHDFGKAGPQVQAHLVNGDSNKIDHASAGMLWVWEAYQQSPKTKASFLTAQIIALSIGYHHSERPDILSLQSFQESLPKRLNDPLAKKLYSESCHLFFAECMPESKLLEEFQKACEEVHQLCLRLSQNAYIKKSLSWDFIHLFLGFTQRFLFSALVDADWADTSHFMKEGSSDFQSLPTPDWDSLAQHAEDFFSSLTPHRPIDHLRQEISDQCFSAGKNAHPGIVRLYVPTGGGKTYSGLRYCLQAAKRQNSKRIFYFAPFRSVISQNTKEFVKVLGSESYILEHHSDAILDSQNESLLQRLQRWQGPALICTSMVQFLNTFFAAPRQNVRRMCALANSILLFDEIQSLPLQHTHLFNMAANFLAEYLNCTIVLCTATQPDLASDSISYPIRFSPEQDIVPDYQLRFEQLRRTHIVLPDFSIRYTAPAIADFVLDKLSSNRSILVILNTRHAVESVFSHVQNVCPSSSHFYCLTTNLCAKHRSDLINRLKSQLADSNDSSPVICISTQLIEAGVDLSFDCVIRSMAGLPSIAQAAGRCNRHSEKASRPVYLLSVAEELENLDSLGEIRNGKRATERLLRQMLTGGDLLSPDCIQAYYQLYYHNELPENLSYPVSIPDYSKQKTTLLDLLSSNKKTIGLYRDNGGSTQWSSWKLFQSFRTAESHFHALESNTYPIVVPYQDGIKIIQQFKSCQKPSAELLKAAQAYVVNITDAKRRTLEKNHALYVTAGGTITVLQDAFYDETQGLKTIPVFMPNLFC